MALGRSLAGSGVLALALWGRPGGAQQVLRGRVVSRDDGTPIAGATVSLRRGDATITDPLGRWRLALGALPDTLAILAIGWTPDTLVLAVAPSAPLSIALGRAPVVVSDLIANESGPGLGRLAPARWTMPISAARAVPPAIETDVYRSLALIPSISFSSPLSSRPLMRGYDAAQVSTRLDGFDVVNLYHLGRIFAAFPADGAERVEVTAPPGTLESGQAVAGLIDIVGRTGTADRAHGTMGTSFGSVSGSLGGPIGGTRVFGAGRLFHAKLLELLPGVHVPYEFEDLYLSGVIGHSDPGAGRITLFATRDRLGQNADRRLDWNNLLLGTSWTLFAGGGVTLDLSTAGARFEEDGRNVPSSTRGSADFTNQVGRWTTTASLAVTTGHARVEVGAEAGYETRRNRIGPAGEPVEAPVDFPSAATAHAGGLLAAWTAVARRFGPLRFEGGARFDREAGLVSVAPRILAEGTFRGVTVRAGVGRTARLDQRIGDERSEPELDFLDLWLPAGDSVPIARVDHVTLDLVVDRRPFVARISLFGSRGVGIGELRSDADQRAAPRSFVRFGRSRTRGLEAQIAIRGGPSDGRSLSISYTYSRSERNWGAVAGWVPWSLDRRHQARAFAQTRHGRVALFGALDLASGTPLTPIAFRLARETPDLPGGEPATEVPAIVYGPENSHQTSGTARVDAGLSYELRRRGRTRVAAGLSILNVFGGAVAPIGTLGVGSVATDPAGRATEYRRRFDLPGIPTLTLRVEF